MTDLVRDLARLHVPFRIILRGLQPGQPAKGARGEFGVARDALHGHDQGVATEERHEPRNTAGRNEDSTLEGGIFEAECLHVPGRLHPGVPYGLVRRVDAHPRQPGCTDVEKSIGHGIASEGRGPAAIARDRQPFEAGVPGAFRRNRRDEHETAIRELRRRVRPLHDDRELALEVAVGVGRAELPT